MGELIRFRPRQGAKPGTLPAGEPLGNGGSGATILLFTGVRYERHEDPPAHAPKSQSPRSGRRKRA
ncbi:MAG: hypothetical protein O9322_03940 [Beijerinckiaceae bacterium]|nr:hypothetical protein [Beijerinckiaceae bacterium]MCZ8298669.1 hypothetical protein [Beijerinckiaceae bacterium]